MSENKTLANYKDTIAVGKDSPTAVLLATFFGFLGIHRIYTGYIKIGLFQLLTCGGFLIWVIIDIFSLFTNRYEDSKGYPLNNYNNRIAVSLVFFAVVILLIWSYLYVGWVQKFITHVRGVEISTPLDNVKRANSNNFAQNDVVIDKEAQERMLDRQAFLNRDFKHKTKSGLNILDDNFCMNTNGNKMICGTVVNVTDNAITNIIIKYILLDDNDKFIAFSEAKVYKLDGMNEWEFKAPIFYKTVKKYKLFKISSY